MGTHRYRRRRRHWREPTTAIASSDDERQWLADLTSELRALVNEWDPIGVVPAVWDEYDYLTGLLLDRLSHGADRASICELVYDEASELGAGTASADAFGAKVYAWFQTKSPPPAE